MRSVILFLIFIPLLSVSAAGQGNYFPRDTTYTIAKDYIKVSKGHPESKPVWPQDISNVQITSNIVYARLESGRELHLDIFRKRRKKSLPAVMMIHGGGWISGSKENQFAMAQRFADNGFVAVTVEYRLGPEAKYPAAVCDLKTAVRFIRSNAREFGIDPDRIAAYGCSAGAHLATLLGATNGLSLFDQHPYNLDISADVQAVLNIDGIASFVHPEAEPEWNGRSANTWLGKYDEHYDNWREASPLEYVDRDMPPILFINSSYPRFHPGRDDMIARLDDIGIYSEVRILEGSPHGFWFYDPWFKPTLDYSVDFLNKVFLHNE